MMLAQDRRSTSSYCIRECVRTHAPHIKNPRKKHTFKYEFFQKEIFFLLRINSRHHGILEISNSEGKEISSPTWSLERSTCRPGTEGAQREENEKSGKSLSSGFFSWTAYVRGEMRRKRERERERERREREKEKKLAHMKYLD